MTHLARQRPIVLLSTPPTDPTQPYSSLPALTAFLRLHGYEVVQRDVAIELLDSLLTSSHLRRACQRAHLRARDNLADPGTSGRGFLERYYGTLGWADYLIAHVDGAKRLMRDSSKFYDLRQYQRAVSILELACELVSLPHYPSRLSCSTYESATELTLSGLWEATADTPANFYYSYLKHTVLPEILALDPLLVGLSVTYHYQLDAAFTMGRLIKTAAPGLHVTMGGAIISEIESHVLSDPEWFRFADSYVVGEGETALVGLADSLRTGQSLNGVPNIVSLRCGRPFASMLSWFEDVEHLPIPDFEGLELCHYLSPEPVLMMGASRGCYYGKCAFCDVSRNTRQKHRRPGKDHLIDSVRKLNARYGTRRILFHDDAMPFGAMTDVAAVVKDEIPSMTWQAEARLEVGFTDEFAARIKAGGCRQLIFGFESGSPRILKAMHKHNTLKTNLMALRACAVHGIAVNLQTFIGFPTESREEAMRTIDFLIEKERMIASIGFGTFKLFAGTPIYKHPDRYGVKRIAVPHRDALLASCDFEACSGLSQDEATRLNAEAMDRLSPIYSRRSHFLGGAAGPHSLLYFSHYDYTSIKSLWQEMDEPRWSGSPARNLDEVIPTRSPAILTARLSESTLGDTTRALCVETGTQFELSQTERELWELCDGERDCGDVVSRWALNQGDNELDGQVEYLARGFATIAEFLKKGLLACAGYSSAPALND